MKFYLSIIVAIYNLEEYLERCLLSIINQTYSNIEIILVDDGSTDSSGVIADKYAEIDSRIKIIHKENGGLVSARKTGLLAAKGEYVCFVDGDDWIEEDTVESILNYFDDKNKIDVIVCGYIEDMDGLAFSRINKANAGVYDSLRLKEEIYPYLLCKDGFYSINIQPFLWNKIIRRELALEHILAVDERIKIGEDVAAMAPIFLSSDRVIITEICKYHYCIRQTSMMKTSEGLEKEREQLKILHKYLINKKWMFEKGFKKNQLYQFTLNNILTRIYPLAAKIDTETNLWPFKQVGNSNKLIIYGAGNFGRAVYTYIKECISNEKIIWVDQHFCEYQNMQLPVDDPKVVENYMDSDILIAVLDSEAIKGITDFLIDRGFFIEKIHSVCVSDENMQNVLGQLGFE